MSEIPPPGPDDQPARVSRSERGPRDDDRDDGGGGHGWMLATVGLVALVLGIVGGLAINGGDEKTRTVHSGVRTVVETAPEPATTSVGITVTQPVRTVERTVTAPPVTVTAPPQTDTTDTTSP